jgi:hypothetical protein
MKQYHQEDRLRRVHLMVSSYLSSENFQFWSYFYAVPFQMTTGTNIDEKLDGADNFGVKR